MAGWPQYLVVNGPARDEAGVDYKHGVLGAGHRANAAIGRALKLLVTNRGEGKLGGTDSTTVGSSSKNGLCFGEWEERAPGWLPMHAENGWGFEKEESVVTAFVTVGATQRVSVATVYFTSFFCSGSG